MPKELHHRLMKTAAAKKLVGNEKAAYVYGTLKKVEKASSKDRAVNKFIKKG